MDIREETSGEFSGWWSIHKPTDKVLSYVKYSIPPVYRNYEGGVWYVHSKYIAGVKALAQSSLSVDQDPYATLYLRQDAPEAIVRAVWRELAKQSHPDHGGDTETFKRYKEAYEAIIKRKE